MSGAVECYRCHEQFGIWIILGYGKRGCFDGVVEGC
jgi:hypothetical protein